MAESKRLVWDDVGEKLYETGTDRGVLYRIDDQNKYSKGYAWNGLTAFNAQPSGADSTDLWANNTKYLSMTAAEQFGATIEAYTFPEEFRECDGSKEIMPGVYAGQQNRVPFGFTARTLIGNDTKDTEYGYKIHMVYGAKAQPSEKGYSTVNESPEAITLSWTISTTPIPFTKLPDLKLKNMSYIEIVSTKIESEKLKKLEDALYGTESTDPYLPTPDELYDLLSASG